MSRIYFHTQTDGTAEVKGSERHQGRWLAAKLGMLPFGFDEPSFARDDWFLSRIEPSVAGEDRRFLRVIFQSEERHAFVAPDGKRHAVWPIFLNTALRLGSDAVKLLVRLNAQCEIHCWCDGPNRAWLAGIIDDGLRDGTLRAGMGWDAVSELLRRRDGEPVVTSYSVTRQFPDREAAGWEPPEAAELADAGAAAGGSDDDAEDHEDSEEDIEDEDIEDETEAAWYALPAPERWSIAMKALRDGDKWLEIKPENFRTYWFDGDLDAFKIQAMQSAEEAAARKSRREAAIARGESPSNMDME